MSDNVKVELSKEFLAHIAVAAQRGGSTPVVEPINFDFDRNSAVSADAVTTYAFLYAEPGLAEEE
jgi:hypothetical protein